MQEEVPDIQSIEDRLEEGRLFASSSSDSLNPSLTSVHITNLDGYSAQNLPHVTRVDDDSSSSQASSLDSQASKNAFWKDINTSDA
jgi:hypothetical protein